MTALPTAASRSEAKRGGPAAYWTRWPIAPSYILRLLPATSGRRRPTSAPLRTGLHEATRTAPSFNERWRSLRGMALSLSGAGPG